jgi:glutathione S-transferase
MDPMRLYSGPLSVFSAKAEIALREKGVPFELIMVRFDRVTHYEPKHPEVVRINPKGQVPVLVDGAVEIFDSTQILEYLEHRCPTPPLWPDAVPARAEARLLELKSDELLCPLVASLWRFRGRTDHP